MKTLKLLFPLFFFCGLHIQKLYPAENSMVLRIPIISIPKTLDPHLGNEFDLNKITKQIYPSLLLFDVFGRPTPNHIKSWAINNDKKTITFQLKADLKFNNGHSVTLDDIKNSLARSQKMGSRILDYTTYNRDCKSKHCEWFTKLNSHSFEVSIKDGSYEAFIRKLSGYEGAIVKKVSDKLIGLGPCIFEFRNKESIGITCPNKNESFKIIYQKTDPTKAVAKFNKGTLDYLNSMQFPFEESQLKNAYVSSNPFVGTMYLGVNFNKKPLPLSTRLALQKCILSSDFSKVLPNTKRTSSLVFSSSIELKPNMDSVRTKNQQSITLLAAEKFKNNEKFLSYFSAIGNCSNSEINIKFGSFRKILKDFRNGIGDLIYKGDGMQNYELTSIYDSFRASSNSNVSGYVDEKLDKLINECEKSSLVRIKSKCIANIEYYLSNVVAFVPLVHITAKEAYGSKFSKKLLNKNSNLIWEFPFSKSFLKGAHNEKNQEL